MFEAWASGKQNIFQGNQEFEFPAVFEESFIDQEIDTDLCLTVVDCRLYQSGSLSFGDQEI